MHAFKAYGVKFVVVEGLAVSWYCTKHQVDDMDLLVNLSPDNSARIVRALSRLDINDLIDDLFTKLGLLLRLKPLHHADLLTPRKDGQTYSDIAEKAVDARLFDIPGRLASASSLILLKKQAVLSMKLKEKNTLMTLSAYESMSYNTRELCKTNGPV